MRVPTRQSMIAAAALLVAGPVVRADTIYWDGVNGVWETAANWSAVPEATTPNPPNAPGTNDTAYFSVTNDTDGAAVTLGADQSVHGMVMRQGAGNIAFNNNTLTVGPGGIHAWNNHINSINSTVRLHGSQTWRGATSGGSSLSANNSTVSRVFGDMADRTLLVQIGATFQPNMNLRNVSDGGTEGTLALWKTGTSFLTLNGSNSHSGGTTISQGNLTVTPGSLPTNGPLILRGTSVRGGGGINLSGAASTFDHDDIRLETGVNMVTMAADSTFNMGTIARSGGVLQINGLIGQTYNVNNPVTNGLLGAWAVNSACRYVTVNGGKLEEVPRPAQTNETALTDPAGNYCIAGNSTITLTAPRFANTLLTGNDFGSTINLGSSGENDLTLNGLMSINGSWSITRSGSSTGRLIIGDAGELVVAGRASFSCSVPIVDGAGGAGRLTLASWTGGCTLSGSNMHSGGTVFCPSSSDPRLNINGVTALGTGTFFMNGNGTGADGLPTLAVIDNTSAGDLTLVNNNTQVWNADFRFAGTRNLNMGTGAVSLGTAPGTFATRTVEVTTNTLTIGGAISKGTHPSYPVVHLAKAGAGTLELTGRCTYYGDTTVSAGTLKLGASGSIASTNITVTAGATLYLTGHDGLPDEANLYLAGVVHVEGGVVDKIGMLWTNGVMAAPGTWGSTASGAQHQDDTLFGGVGKIRFGQAKGTIILLR